MIKPVLHAELKEAGQLKTMVRACSLVIEEGTFTATPKGISLRMMDASHVSLIDAYLDGSYFETYELEKNITFAVMIDTLNKVLKHVPDKNPVTLDVDNTSITVKSRGGKYKITANTPDIETQNLPKIEPEATVTFPADMLSALIERTEIMGDAVTLTVRDEPAVLVLSSKDDSGSATITVPDKEFTGIVISREVTTPVISAYNFEYMSPVIKALKGEIKIGFGSGKPILVESANGVIRYYVAPRVEQ